MFAARHRDTARSALRVPAFGRICVLIRPGYVSPRAAPSRGLNVCSNGTTHGERRRANAESMARYYVALEHCLPTRRISIATGFLPFVGAPRPVSRSRRARARTWSGARSCCNSVSFLFCRFETMVIEKLSVFRLIDPRFIVQLENTYFRASPSPGCASARALATSRAQLKKKAPVGRGREMKKTVP